ncbi:MAG: hypothetical protein PVG03_16780, partial [Desulfarculaceae bacterium]
AGAWQPRKSCIANRSSGRNIKLKARRRSGEGGGCDIKSKKFSSDSESKSPFVFHRFIFLGRLIFFSCVIVPVDIHSMRQDSRTGQTDKEHQL